MGHALNKILKDIINRVALQSGKRVQYVPGWDCHGLPIELKALEKLGGIEKGKTMTPMEIRNAARKLAERTVESQMQAFRSWAIMGDWANSYKTMNTDYEMRQLNVFKDMAAKDLIYRRFKPVYWSPTSGTALAEAELEYNEAHTSKAAFVKFGIVEEMRGHKDLSALIWTTTPWTLPANRAMAVGKEMEYTIIQHPKHGKMIIASSRLTYIGGILADEKITIIEAGIPGAELVGLTYLHPLLPGAPSPILHADFVSGDSGTGVVHIAPGHGMDDYLLCQQHNIAPFSPVDDAGCFTADAGFPELEKLEVQFAGNRKVLELLTGRNALLHVANYKHKYPYDWRTKKPIIVRSTAQWFADVSNIKSRAVESLESVVCHPDTGRSRLASFVAGRNEWCISRQRSWGVPIPAVYHSETGEPLLTPESVTAIITALSELGTNAWFNAAIPTSRFLPADTPDVYTRKTETMDVWFDSGTSWTLLPERTPETTTLYLEGTDQARGWFQSSLLTSLATTPSPPFTHLITHGFVLDATGKKMSKSLGNVTSPSAATFPGGADHIRLWAAGSDYTKDITIGPTSISAALITLQKARSTLRFLQAGTKPTLHPNTPASPPMRLDRTILAMLHELETSVTAAYKANNFARALKLLSIFNTSHLSGLYLDATKDRMYTHPLDSLTRLASQRTYIKLFDSLVTLWAPLAPLLCTEARGWAVEAFVQRGVADEAALKSWEQIARVRAAVRKAVQVARKHDVKSGIECEVLVTADTAGWEKVELEEVLIVAGVKLGEWKESRGVWEVVEKVEGGGKVRVRKAQGQKCPRCWVSRSKLPGEVCGSCESALEKMELKLYEELVPGEEKALLREEEVEDK